MMYLVLRDKVTKHVYMSQTGGLDGSFMKNVETQPDINVTDVEEVRMTAEEYAVATAVPPDLNREKVRKGALRKLESLGLTREELTVLGL